MKTPHQLSWTLGAGFLATLALGCASTAEGTAAKPANPSTAASPASPNAVSPDAAAPVAVAPVAVAPIAVAPVAAAPDAAAQSRAASAPAAGAETDDEAIALADRIEKMVEELRGLQFKHPVKKGVYDKERLAKFLEEQMKKENSYEQFRWQEKAWKMLGLLPKTMDMQKTVTDLLLEQIGGFYDPEGKELRVMRGFSGLLGEVLMAHELCHALEDQYYDLKGIDDRQKKEYPDDDDRQFAAHSVMEGSATVLMNEFMMKRMKEGGLSKEALLNSADLNNPALRGDLARNAPPILVKPLIEMYMSGATFLARGKGMMGMGAEVKPEDRVRAFETPPVSSEQILHWRKYWVKKDLDVPKTIDIGDVSAELGEGWKRLGQNVFGELGVAILTKPPEPKEEHDVEGGEKPADNPMADMMKMLTERKETPESKGWDGDRYQLYGGPEGALLLVWVSSWDTEKDANEIQEWLAGRFTGAAWGEKPLIARAKVIEDPTGPRVDFILTNAPEKIAAAEKAVLEKTKIRE